MRRSAARVDRTLLATLEPLEIQLARVEQQLELLCATEPVVA